MQVLRNIQVQLGGRSLDLPVHSVPTLPSLGQLRHHTRRIFGVPAQQTPVFFHNDTRVVDERGWSSLLSEQSASLSLRLQMEPSPPLQPYQIGDQAQESLREEMPPEVRTDYFAVQGKSGNTTLYLQKSDFDRRMAEFAREGSLGQGMRAIFPPAYKDEYMRLFHDAGANIVVSTQATALLQQWHQRLAVGGGVMAGLAGGLYVAGTAETALGAGGIVAAEAVEGAEVGAAAFAATEASSGGAAAGVTGMATAAATAATVAVLVGYATYRGLKWLLPEVGKEHYTILMNVANEDPNMLEIGQQMSVVESADGPSCGICMERVQDAAAIPCGHTACMSCLEKLRRRGPCPHCRAPIKNIQRIYL